MLFRMPERERKVNLHDFAHPHAASASSAPSHLEQPVRPTTLAER
jgi:hypothetical protein